MTIPENKKILITGLTGQVARPVALAYAEKNSVWGLARFGNQAVKKELEAAGITCVTFDLSKPDFTNVPDDFDYVLNFAVSFDPDFDANIETIVEGFGLLVNHCRKARAVLHCSTTAVYLCNDHHPLKETDPLGDSHRAISPTYSICKIAAEGMARYCAKQWNLPTVIARLNVPYGDNGGWPWLHLEMILAGQPIPVHTNKPSAYTPIHQDDIIDTIPKLLNAASIPATIVNWAGNESVSVEEWCEYMAGLVGKPVQFTYTDQTIESTIADTTKMHKMIGKTKVHWKDGMRRMIEAMHPEIKIQGEKNG